MTRAWTGSLRSDRPLGSTVKRRHLNGVLGSSVRSRPTNVSGPLARGGGAATAGAAQADSTRRATPIAVLMTGRRPGRRTSAVTVGTRGEQWAVAGRAKAPAARASAGSGRGARPDVVGTSRSSCEEWERRPCAGGLGGVDEAVLQEPAVRASRWAAVGGPWAPQ